MDEAVADLDHGKKYTSYGRKAAKVDAIKNERKKSYGDQTLGYHVFSALFSFVFLRIFGAFFGGGKIVLADAFAALRADLIFCGRLFLFGVCAAHLCGKGKASFLSFYGQDAFSDKDTCFFSDSDRGDGGASLRDCFFGFCAEICDFFAVLVDIFGHFGIRSFYGISRDHGGGAVFRADGVSRFAADIPACFLGFTADLAR